MNLNCLKLQKIIVNRRVLLAIMAIFFLNLITSYYIYQDQAAGRVTYSSDSYRAVYNDLENMNAEQAYVYLENYMNEIIQMDGETEKQKFRYTGEAAAERFLISEIMRGKEIQHGPSKGIRLFANTVTTDFSVHSMQSGTGIVFYCSGN